MLAKPIIPVLIFSPSFHVFKFFSFFKIISSNLIRVIVACLSDFGMVSKLDCTEQKGEVQGEKEELGDKGGR